jgi:mycofactocin precursor
VPENPSIPADHTGAEDRTGHDVEAQSPALGEDLAESLIEEVSIDGMCGVY